MALQLLSRRETREGWDAGDGIEGEPAPATVSPSEAGAFLGGGDGPALLPSASSTEDCPWTHEAVRSSMQLLMLDKEPARDSSTAGMSAGIPEVSTSSFKVDRGVTQPVLWGT